MTVGRYGMVLCLAVALAAGTATAATRNVPVPYATIEDAIAAADPNDTIVVGNGDYPENIVIDVEGLALISVNGPGATSISGVLADTPVITIDADRVTVGAASRGFTIIQEQAGAGNSTIQVNGAVVGPDTVRIRNNLIEGDGASVGILVTANIEGGHLVIRDNTFRATAGAAGAGFTDGIVFESGDYTPTPIGGWVSVHTGAVDILNNLMRGIDRNAIWFASNVFSSTIAIDDCEIIGHDAPASEGVTIKEDLTAFSSMSITGTTIDGFQDGVHVWLNIAAQSSLSIVGTDITDFTDSGTRVGGEVETASTFRVENCTLSGDGAEYGIYFSDHVTSGSAATIADNRISGFYGTGIRVYAEDGAALFITNDKVTGEKASRCVSTEAAEGALVRISGNTLTGFGDNGDNAHGVYVGDVNDGSMIVIDGNKATALASGDKTYGIFFNHAPYSGSTGYVQDNTIDEFNYGGVYAEDVYTGSYLEVSGNVLTGQTAGADYGIWLNSTYDGSETVVHDNKVSNYDYCGLCIDDTYSGELTVTDNTLTAHTDGAEYGVYTYDIYEHSTATVAGNQVSGFGNKGPDEYGFYNEGVYEGSQLYFADNTFNAHANGADHGFFTSNGWEEGSTGVFERNTFTGFIVAGFYNDEYVVDDCRLTLHDNKFTAHTAGAEYGILAAESDMGPNCHVAVTENTVAGFTGHGLYVYTIGDASALTVSDNVFTAHTDGAGTGITILDINTGSTAVVRSNRVEGVKDDGGTAEGVEFGEVSTGSRAEICGNTILPHADGASYGFFFGYMPQDGGTLVFCDNNVAGFSDAQLRMRTNTPAGGTLEIRGNNLKGGHYGVYFNGVMEQGSVFTIAQNTIHEFDETGVFFDDVIWGTDGMIHYNRIFGGGTDAGIEFASSINSGATVDIMGNCFDTVPEAVRVEMVEDTAVVTINQNDFEGATSDGVRNVNSDADHVIDAENNFWGPNTALGVADKVGGYVDFEPFLSATPDVDGDGVTVCGDLCPETAAGDAVDANGCSCLQLNPDGDVDADGVLDCLDNCPTIPNAAQLDSNGDGIGDACQAAPVPAIPAPQPAPGCGACGNSGAAMYSFMGLTYGLVLLMRRRRP